MWPTGRMKLLPYEQVSYTVKTNVHTVSMHNKGLRDGNNYTRRLIYDSGYYGQRTIVSTAVNTRQRNNIRPGDDKQCGVKIGRV